MNLLIIHLGDIHLKSEEDIVLSRVEKITDTIKNNIHGYKSIFICVTGDIAFSGAEKQYNIAEQFFDDIRKELERYATIPIHFIFVPGNHDCILKSDDPLISGELDVRDVLIQTIRKQDSPIPTGLINNCTKIQSNFFKFEEKLTVVPLVNNDNVYKSFEFTFGNEKILFLGFNTAWISTLPEKAGQLKFPIDLIPNICEDYSLIVSLQHHTFNWLEPNNSKHFINSISKTVDVILTGHEHVSDSKTVIDNNNNFTEFVDGGVLQESSRPEISEFNILDVDTINKRFKYHKLSWNKDKYCKEQAITKDFSRYSKSSSKKLEFSSDFKTYLNDPSATFTHPHKDDITLDDLYIYPDLQEIGDDNSNASTDNKSAKLLEDELPILKRVLITGEERSGKTTLLKNYTVKLFENGYIPILIKGKEISSTSIDEFINVAANQLYKQFENSGNIIFDQLDYSKVFIIIDDLENISITNPKYKNRFFSNIKEYFPNIITTGDQAIKFQEFLSSSYVTFDDFKKYELKAFGNLLQYKLVRQWHTIGLHEYISQEALTYKIDESMDTIKNVIGKNLVPAYPIFILTILQASESFTNRSKNVSSYGFYYELLLKDALYKVLREDDEIYLYFNILSEFAYFLYDEKLKNISKDNFEDFIDKYCADYKITLNYEKIINNLKKAHYFTDTKSFIEFRYSYIYYFFLASYMANNITSKEVLISLSFMCGRLHKVDYSNIIMFLTHLSNDSIVRDTLLETANDLFSDIDIIELDGDVRDINCLSIKYTPLVFNPNHDVEKFREEQFQNQDNLENNSSTIENDRLNQNEAKLEGEIQEELDFSSELNKAMKTMEIIGQIAKKHYGSIKGDDKSKLVLSTFKLGLRSLNYILSFFNDVNNYILSELKSKIKEKKIETKTEIESEAKTLLFNLYTLVCFIIIQKIGSSIGSPKLSQIYKEICEQNPINSYKLIRASVQLDSSSSLPISEIEKLYEEVKGNSLAKKTLQFLVLQHLNYYPISDYRIKQRLCDTVEIKWEEQRKLEVKSREYKRQS